MTDNGPSPEYLFIYPWTVTAAVLADTRTSIVQVGFLSSSPAQGLTSSVDVVYFPAMIEY